MRQQMLLGIVRQTAGIKPLISRQSIASGGRAMNLQMQNHNFIRRVATLNWEYA